MSGENIVRRAVLVAIVLPVMAFRQSAEWTAAASAAPTRIVLRAVRPLAPGIDALPRIEPAPGRPGAGRINVQLAAIDRSFLRDPDVVFCRTPWDGPYGVTRSVTITLRGTRYLSLLLVSECYRGAHPATTIDALTFDVFTGTRLKPADLLPRSLHSAEAATLSRRLSLLYMETAKATRTFTCTTGTYTGGANMFLTDRHTFAVWADARGDGIGLEPDDFPFVSSACTIPLIVPAARMRALGVTPSLLDDITRARARRWY
jgi:hypothetical protein